MNGAQIAQEAVRRLSTGVCRFCACLFDRGGMASHLKSCPKRKSDPGAGGNEEIFQLFVEGGPDYWLHVEIGGGAALSDLDVFLREIWLECCGHLSGFTIEKKQYMSHPMKEYEQKGMSAKLCQILRPRMKFYHAYDFGTTTHLSLKVLSVRTGRTGKEWVRILARNNPPAIPCDFCPKTATNLCPFCIGENTGFVCDACMGEHECDDNDGETFLPFVNSPRTGMCGYTGPSKEPA